MDAPDLRYDATSRAASQWLDHVTLGLSDDGLVYHADRRDSPLQVLIRQGERVQRFRPVN